MILRKVLTLIQLVLVSNSTPLETSVQLNRQFLPGLFPNYNLCQIFSPVSNSDDGKFFTGAKANGDINEHVRYIVLHKCRWSAKQDNLYGPFLNEAYECEDTSFVQVLQTCHEEVAFIWSKGSFNDNFPSGFGLDLTNHYLMLMIIYEGLNGGVESDNSGMILTYDKTYKNVKK